MSKKQRLEYLNKSFLWLTNFSQIMLTAQQSMVLSKYSLLKPPLNSISFVYAYLVNVFMHIYDKFLLLLYKICVTCKISVCIHAHSSTL